MHFQYNTKMVFLCCVCFAHQGGPLVCIFGGRRCAQAKDANGCCETTQLRPLDQSLRHQRAANKSDTSRWPRAGRKNKIVWQRGHMTSCHHVKLAISQWGWTSVCDPALANLDHRESVRAWHTLRFASHCLWLTLCYSCTLGWDRFRTLEICNGKEKRSSVARRARASLLGL